MAVVSVSVSCCCLWLLFNLFSMLSFNNDKVSGPLKFSQISSIFPFLIFFHGNPRNIFASFGHHFSTAGAPKKKEILLTERKKAKKKSSAEMTINAIIRIYEIQAERDSTFFNSLFRNSRCFSQSPQKRRQDIPGWENTQDCQSSWKLFSRISGGHFCSFGQSFFSGNHSWRMSSIFDVQHPFCLNFQVNRSLEFFANCQKKYWKQLI